MLGFLQHLQEYDGPTIDDPALLGTVSVPALVLDGADSGSFLHASTRHVADHIPDARTREITGAAHAAHWTHPEAFADALSEFFSSADQPAHR